MRIVASLTILLLALPSAAQITSVTVHGPSQRFVNGSDIYPITWADDGALYTAGGDGDGWDGVDTRGLDFNRIDGGPTDYVGTEIFHKVGVLPKGLLAIGNVIYMAEQERNNGFGRLRIGQSTDYGENWQFLVDADTGWTYAEPDKAFANMSFVNYGQAYAGARDGFVYAISSLNTNGSGIHDEIFMMRVPIDSVRDRTTHQYFAGLDGGLDTWTDDITARQPFFTRTDEIHWGPSVNYNLVLQRYLLCIFTDNEATLAVYDGPEPWGPWVKIHEATLLDTTEKHSAIFVNKNDGTDNWISNDGLEWWMVVAGLNRETWDSFNVVRVTLTVSDDNVAPAAPTRLMVY